jgi:Zn-dependent M28 family amino/carboxypeptidase
MRSFNRLLAAALLMTLGFGTGSAFAVSLSVGDIVNQVSQASYTDYLNNHLYTHNGNSRYYAGSQHDAAQTEIYNSFASLGLTTSLSPFTYNSQTYYNVVGVLPGTVHPDQVYIVGAHYDSANATCPGADDNASGVAGVIEAARALSEYQFGSTIVFMAFDREEQGLVGSFAYAAAHASDDIRGMVSMDMIAYNPSGTNHDKAYLSYAGSSGAPSIVSDLGSALTQYGGITPVPTQSYSSQSDHYPFYAYGFESVLLIERNAGSNPYYHTSLDSVDTVGYIDYAYATNMTRGVVGYLASEAVIVPEPSTLVFLGIGALLLLIRVRRRTAG